MNDQAQSAMAGADIAHQWLKKSYQEWNGHISTWTPEQAESYRRELGLLVDFVTDCWPKWWFPKWIPCSAQRSKPDGLGDDDVLVLTKSGRRLVARMAWRQSSSAPHFWITTSGGSLEWDEVTHWMPFPPAPGNDP